MKRLVSFFEIPAADMERAVKFYESVLNVKLQIVDCGETEKMSFFPEEEDGNCPGAISMAEDFKPSDGGVMVSLQVESIDAATSLIESNGGRIIIPRTKILSEGRGYFAVFIDSEGNRVGLYED